MLAFFWFPSSAKNDDFRCLEGTFSVFLCFLCILRFLEFGSKKGGKTVPKDKKAHLLLEVIFGTFATLSAACFSGVFLEVTFLHFL